MKNSNELIQNLNHSLVKIELLHTSEELTQKIEKFKHLYSEEFLSRYEKNCIEVEINYNTSYLAISQDFLPTLINHFNTCGLKYKITNMWDLDNIDDLINFNNDPCVELTETFFPDFNNSKEKIINVFNSRYTKDDVLDKIIENGVSSINKLQKQILEK